MTSLVILQQMRKHAQSGFLKLLLLGLMLWSTPTEAAWSVSPIAYQCDSSAPSSNGFTTDAINMTGADFAYGFVQHFNLGEDAVLSDISGTTYTQIAQKDQSFIRSRSYYAYGLTVNSSHTWTITGNSGAFVAVAGFSGSHATPLDQNATSGNSGTSITSGTITPSVDNTLVMNAWGTADGYTQPVTVDESYTLLCELQRGSNANGGALAYRIQGTAAATDPTWANATSVLQTTHIASFKPALTSCVPSLATTGAGKC